MISSAFIQQWTCNTLTIMRQNCLLNLILWRVSANKVRILNRLQSQMLGFDFGKAAELKRFARDFEQLQKIGSGGFSTVYKVRNKLDNRYYAMKVIQIKPSHHKNGLTQHFEKMFNQAKILASLNHANVVKYYGCWIQCEEKTAEDYQLEEQDNPKPFKQNHRNSSQEGDGDFEMVMYDDDSNSGIQFAHDSQDYKQKSNSSDAPKGCSKPVKTPKQRENQSIYGEQQSSVFQKYKHITIYIQTELCSTSLQHFVQQRNIKRAEAPSKRSNNRKNDAIQNYKFILETIRGLSYIHSRKIIHRDIKLQNIIINQRGICKIIDFGLAKKVRSFGSVHVDPIFTQKIRLEPQMNVDEQIDQKYSSSVGTKIFSSPEQASSNKYDHRTDIYSLGMIIAILFSRFTTVHGQRQLLMNIRNKNLAQVNMDLRLKDALLRCLSQQKLRPSLEQLSFIIKNLLREELELSNSVSLTNGIDKIDSNYAHPEIQIKEGTENQSQSENKYEQKHLTKNKQTISCRRQPINNFTMTNKQQTKILKSCSEWCYQVIKGGHFYRKRKILTSGEPLKFQPDSIQLISQ